ncbi:hypothetical protein NEF87_004883 [Candidatus Lokiarchaeum ossiferum]|uniref:Uncharacterized protein n=1 Tax=Candidatus Lokiarchaeum ossiferum TaxID=2951803 RepID=A0ABY6HYI4_9ARCH|nr:hypothetical protein NEF87_004883 [Candidatus Lokiarchaeum sp. B-35]
MSIGISGYFEVKKNGKWVGIEYLYKRTLQNYEMYSIFFGMRYHTIEPIAYNRGIPDFASEEFLADYEKWGSDAGGATFLSAKEYAAIDWEKSDEDEYLIVEYELIDNQLIYKRDDHSWNLKIPSQMNFDENLEIHDGNRVFKKEFVSRQFYIDHYADSNWLDLLRDFGELGEKHGLENVRMVVFFM